MSPYKPYPEGYEYRSGCKVSWHIYDNPDDANRCAEAARYNAKIDAAMGYDFGFCIPGNITRIKDGRFEVCIP